MIIARLANAIRHQNWSQIITEILIVVIGIFLGLQVQAWYDGRQARAEEAQLVDYMIVDLQSNIEYLERREASYNRSIERGVRVLDLLKGPVLEAEDIEDFTNGLRLDARPPGRDSSLISFKNNDFDTILNPVLKRNIFRFITEMDTDEITLQSINLRLESVAPAFNTKAYVGTPRGVPWLVDYNFEELRKDNEFRIALTVTIGSIQGYRGRTLGTKRLCEILLSILKDYRAGKAIEEVSFEGSGFTELRRGPV